MGISALEGPTSSKLRREQADQRIRLHLPRPRDRQLPPSHLPSHVAVSQDAEPKPPRAPSSPTPRVASSSRRVPRAPGTPQPPLPDPETRHL
uniref:Uncharacterized protein n=1 Tax=Setaria viridis TaxID=4556 RepID=A0A4U6U488_SETVI|nr:hypothetical protein SEVIR_7G145150v2 [Setaria viridis]